MGSMWSWVISQYKGYAGTGMIAGLFLVALIWLFVSEKNKNIRIIFIYMPAVVLFLFFCPFFAKVVRLFTGRKFITGFCGFCRSSRFSRTRRSGLCCNARERRRLSRGRRLPAL